MSTTAVSSIMDLITADDSWIANIPEAKGSSNNEQERLLAAYKHSKKTPLSNEHTSKALTILGRFGLVVERAESLEESSVPLTKYIADTLLNFALINKEPCNHRFCLKVSSDKALQLPARSHLLLLFLAEKLEVSIYLFSSRSKSLLFTPCDATKSKQSIGLFYNVDSYHGIGEFLVLAPSTRPLDLSSFPVRESTPPNSDNLTPVATTPDPDNHIPVASFKTEGENTSRQTRPLASKPTFKLNKEDGIAAFETRYVALWFYFFKEVSMY
jgi:hypothetical protein